MLKTLRLSINTNADDVTRLAHALSSPTRIEILKLLSYQNLSIKEIAHAIDQPLNTTLNHIKILEDSGVIATQTSYTSKGKSKSCYRIIDAASFVLFDPEFEYIPTKTHDEYSIPIGSFFDFDSLTAPCGMASSEKNLGLDNDVSIFFSPDRFKAQIVWLTCGLLEYRVPLPDRQKLKTLSGIEISFEVCSEAPLYNNDYKSDISLFLNDKKIGVYTSTGDFGGRRGLLNPDFWPLGLTQYGVITSWEIDDRQATVNSNFTSFVGLRELKLDEIDKPYLSIKIGVEPNAAHVGGMNLFGKDFGDFPQDIIFRYVY